jgi:hypothetical protein
MENLNFEREGGDYARNYPEAFKIQNESPHFHCIEKGCKIRSKVLLSTDHRSFAGAYCMTHKKNICKCGWEFGWHGGTHRKVEKFEWQKSVHNKPNPHKYAKK